MVDVDEDLVDALFVVLLASVEQDRPRLFSLLGFLVEAAINDTYIEEDLVGAMTAGLLRRVARAGEHRVLFRLSD